VTAGGALAHRCTACTDWDRHHCHEVVHVRPAGGRRVIVTGPCRVFACPCTTYQAGPTEVYPLYHGTGDQAGTRLDHVLEPGSVLRDEVSCGCQECRNYYREHR